jgi:hypothetical protein
MKRIFTLLVLVFAVITAQSEVIRKNYDISNLSISTKGGFQMLLFDNMLNSGVAGEPALPYYAVKLLLPPGHEAVNITFEGSGKVNLEGYYKLYPMQYSRPLSVKGLPLFKLNEEIYASVNTFPKTPTGNLSTHFMNGYAYALSTFTPVEYIPSEGTISYYTSVTITIETQPTSKASNALLNLTSNTESNARCRIFAQNPEKADQYSSASRSLDNYDILIITPEAFTTQLHSLADHYQHQGLKTHITTTQYIQSHLDGNDMPEKIRNLIIHEYQNYGIRQVILGGDVEHVPYRGFYCAAQSSVLYEDDDIPSDLYYSALDGNWNTNDNQLWGEIGEDDLLPDISVGRLSFSTNLELGSMLNKTKQYQNHPVEGELNNHLLAGENLYDNPVTWGSDYLELLIGHRTDNGYTTSGIPEGYPIMTMYDEDSYWSPQALMSSINAGRSFINHVGHANDIYTMKLYNWDITNSNFYGVNGISHNFPIVYTHGCICGAFDVNDCIAEMMVGIQNFAVAFVGNSRYGWFNEGQTEGPSAHLNREFMDALFTDSLNRIGSAHMESKIATSPWVNAPGQWEEGALRWCFYDCNVLGDPAMAVWTNEPIQVEVSAPLAVPVGVTSFEVIVTSQGQPAGGLTAAVIRDNILLGKGITNSTGVAEVVLDSALYQPGIIDIVVSGYNCKAITQPVMVDRKDIMFSDVKVFPNPATEKITVSSSTTLLNTTFHLKDVSGKAVREFILTTPQSELTIPTGDLEPGIYFLNYNNSGKEHVTKIIIQ